MNSDAEGGFPARLSRLRHRQGDNGATSGESKVPFVFVNDLRMK